MIKSKKLFICRILLALLGVLVIILVLKYLPNIFELTVSPSRFRNYIFSLGSFGFIVFIFFQSLQTVIAPIPGEAIQIAGGYIYGVPLGVFYTTIGMLFGAIIAFFFTRFIGGSFIQKLIKKKNFQWITGITENKKFSIILFIFFLVPGLPKDFLIYIAGLTPIKPVKFFGILVISRLPWILASVSIGSNIYHRNYIPTILLSLIALASFTLGILYKDKLINRLSQSRSI